jgi:alpha-beta hydrolase superfamily lysophospholipase
MFRKEGFGFAGLDLPGHGKSEGRRGVISGFAMLHEMLDILISSCRKTFPGVPLYLYGHSLGGGIVIDYILRKDPRIDGAIVTSPWLRLSFEPPRAKLVLAAIMKNILPGLVQPSGLNTGHLSHDRQVIDNYNADPLVHDRISVGLFHSAMAAASRSLHNASLLKRPMVLIHGSDDMITSPEGSRRFASGNPLVNLRIWEGGYHELHNESFRDEVFEYIVSWIKGSDSFRRKNN